MANRPNLVILGAMAVLLTASNLYGCGTSKHFPMRSDAPEALSSFNVSIGISQSEIEPKVKVATDGWLFGLPGAIVAASLTQGRINLADEFIGPLREALLDYDFPSKAISSVKPELIQLPWKMDSNIQLVRSSLQESYETRLEESTEDALLLLTYEYYAAGDFSSLGVTIHAAMFPTHPELYSLRNSRYPAAEGQSPISPHLAMYRNSFSVDIGLPSDNHDPKESVRLWSENEARRAKRALDLALSRAARMLYIDIQMPAGQVKGTGQRPSHRLNGKQVIFVSEEDGYTIYRTIYGTLYAYSKLAE